MSTDIFLQDFADPAPDRSGELDAALRPLLDDSLQNLITGDGWAAVYGLDSGPVTGVMFNDIVGHDAWQVIYDTAVAADWIVMPVSSAVCIVSEAQRSTIPADAAEAGVLLIASGAELKAAVEA